MIRDRFPLVTQYILQKVEQENSMGYSDAIEIAPQKCNYVFKDRHLTQTKLTRGEEDILQSIDKIDIIKSKKENNHISIYNSPTDQSRCISIQLILETII